MDIKQQHPSKIEQDKEDMNSIPQEFYDIRYGWLQVIIGAVYEYHPFIREFLAKYGGYLYGRLDNGHFYSYLEVCYVLLSNMS